MGAFESTPTLPSAFAELASRVATLERLANSLDDGAATSPGLKFRKDADTGIVRLGDDRFGFVTAGVVRAYFQSDGTFVVPDTAAGDPTNLTSGTAPGSIVTGFNRAFRAINAARTGTVRLITVGSSDQIVIGSGGTEGGPSTQIVLRTNAGNPQTEFTAKCIFYVSVADQTAKVTIDAGGTPLAFDNISSGGTVVTTKRAGDSVARMAQLESGRAEYSDGTNPVDVIVIPRNAANEWRLAKGYIKLDDTTSGAFVNLAPRASSGVPNNSVYVNSTGGKLTFKDGSGVDNALY